MTETITIADTDPMIGEIVKGVYRIDELIGQGGMGAVYRARQLSVDRDVVIKMLRASDDRGLNDLLTKRFRREALATSRLNHPNTISVIDFGETEDATLFLVLEFLPGVPLNKVIASEKRIELKRVAKISQQICRSLNEAHAARVIHRDLKPENVFLCDYRGDFDVVKVMDFGVARLVDPTESNDERITRAGLTVGTPMYIAPEQAMGQEVGPSTDLYAFGVMLYEMLSGAPPFAAATGMEMALKHIRETPAPCRIEGAPEPVVARWRELVESLLLKDPKARPQSAIEVADWVSRIEQFHQNLLAAPQLRAQAAEVASVHAAPAAALHAPEAVALSTPEPLPRPPAARRTTVRKREVTEDALAPAPAPEVPAKKTIWAQLAIPAVLVAFITVVVWVITSHSGGTTVGGVSVDRPAAPGTTAPVAAPGPTGATNTNPESGGVAVTSRAVHVDLDSTPSGARVYQGSRLACTTPCQTTLQVGAGPTTLELRRSGYAPTRFTIAPGQARYEAKLTLNKP